MENKKIDTINGRIIEIKEQSINEYKNRTQIIKIILTQEVINIFEFHKKNVKITIKK